MTQIMTQTFRSFLLDILIAPNLDDQSVKDAVVISIHKSWDKFYTRSMKCSAIKEFNTLGKVHHRP